MRRQTTGRFRIGGRRNRRMGSRSTPVPKGRRLVASFVGTIPYLIGIAAFCGGVLGIHFGYEAVCGSSRLAIRVVDLSGNERVRPADVPAYTGIKVGEPILRTDLDKAALQLRRHPWVRAAHVQRRLPDRIQVTITEQRPAIVVALGGLYLANEEGEVFKRLSPDDRIDLPVITGLKREETADRLDAMRDTVRAGIALADACQEESAALGQLDELNFDADLGWSVVTRPSIGGRSGLRLFLGHTPIPRLKTAGKALKRMRQHDLEPEVLWADGLKNPSRVQARLRDSTSETDATFIAKAR